MFYSTVCNALDFLKLTSCLLDPDLQTLEDHLRIPFGGLLAGFVEQLLSFFRFAYWIFIFRLTEGTPHLLDISASFGILNITTESMESQEVTKIYITCNSLVES